MESGQQSVLFDPQPLWLEAVEAVLVRLEIGIALKTTDPFQAVTAVGHDQPALLVADLEQMPATLGAAAFLSRCHDARPGLRSIVLSADQRFEHIDATLRSGAAAYVLKSAHPDDLAAAIRQAFDASVFLAPPSQLWRALGERSSPVNEVGLTRRELEILRLAAEGRSNAELARLLWVTEQTVKFHLSNVYRKLGVANRTEAALWAHSRGLLDHGDASRDLTPTH